MSTPFQLRELIENIRRGPVSPEQLELLCSFAESKLPVSIPYGKICPNCSFRMNNRSLCCPSCEHQMRQSKPYKSAPVIQSTDCLICLSTCTEPVLECGHLFHKRCIVSQCRDRHKTTCPTCKKASALLTEYLSH
jgi:hypothetical protein